MFSVRTAVLQTAVEHCYLFGVLFSFFLNDMFKVGTALADSNWRFFTLILDLSEQERNTKEHKFKQNWLIKRFYQSLGCGLSSMNWEDSSMPTFSINARLSRNDRISKLMM